MATILFKFVFLSNASPAVVLTSTELTGATAPTVNISSVAIADGTTIASVVAGGALVYDSNTKSWSYRLAAADLATYIYTAMATTTYATASPASVHALGMVIPDILPSSLETTLTAIKGAGWTTETLVAIDVLIDAIKAKTDLITTGTALTVVSAISGSIMTLSMTASYSATITGLTIPATWTKIWWTLKASAEDADSAAILQLVVSNPAVGASDGVLYVMGAAASIAQRTLGSLTVNQAGGTVAVALDETLTAALRASSGFVWDVKSLESGGDADILTSGGANIVRTVTRAVA